MFPFPNQQCAGAAPATTWTFNPADINGATLSNGDRTMNYQSGAIASARGGTGRSSGKLYTELVPGGTQSGSVSWVGFATLAHVHASNLGSAGSFGYSPSGSAQSDGGSAVTYATYAAGDVIGVAIDFAAAKAWFSKNGVWQSGDPATGTGGLALPSGTLYGSAKAGAAGSCTIPTLLTYGVTGFLPF